MTELVLAPTDFVALVNQTFELALPFVAIEGELVNFRVSRNRWVYFDLKDELASVSFFGSVYSLPGPLQDGMAVRAVGVPRLHPRFGFSISFQSITPVGQGTIKQAADLLAKKLAAEGLFAPERKRSLPALPATVGLITAAGSAAYSDFIKIAAERWAGLTIKLVDSQVQGEAAPLELVRAIEYLNQTDLPDVLVMVRGGGSAEDLAAFNDERVVRAIAASRIPTLVAIGHESDTSLAELAADVRASTPSNAAQLVVPDKFHQLELLGREQQLLRDLLARTRQAKVEWLAQTRLQLATSFGHLIADERAILSARTAAVRLLNPAEVLQRGYAIVRVGNQLVRRAAAVKPGSPLDISLADGKIQAIAKRISTDGS